MNAQNTTPTKPLAKIADRVEALATELHDRARLATAEAKRAWDRAHLERVTAELTHAKDDTKVQLHLASLDARDALHAMEKRIHELREKAGLGLDHVAKDWADELHRLARILRGDKVPQAHAKT